MTKMARAHQEGRINHVGTTLTVNLHSLFTTDSHNLGLIKKVLMLALQLKAVTTIEFQVWDYVSGRDYHYYRCLPFDIFLTHIAPCICKNPRGISIVYDNYYAPKYESDKALVIGWYFHFWSLCHYRTKLWWNACVSWLGRSHRGNKSFRMGGPLVGWDRVD